MVENNIDLPCSLPEGRPSKKPTIDQVLRLFENQNKHALHEGDRLIRQFADPLTPVQSEILRCFRYRPPSTVQASGSDVPRQPGAGNATSAQSKCGCRLNATSAIWAR